MAPEVMDPALFGGGYDSKADIWSLGITLLELAKGRAPYAAHSPMMVREMVTEGDRALRCLCVCVSVCVPGVEADDGSAAGRGQGGALGAQPAVLRTRQTGAPPRRALLGPVRPGMPYPTLTYPTRSTPPSGLSPSVRPSVCPSVCVVRGAVSGQAAGPASGGRPAAGPRLAGLGGPSGTGKGGPDLAALRRGAVPRPQQQQQDRRRRPLGASGSAPSHHNHQHHRYHHRYHRHRRPVAAASSSSSSSAAIHLLLAG